MAVVLVSLVFCCCDSVMLKEWLLSLSFRWSQWKCLFPGCVPVHVKVSGQGLTSAEKSGCYWYLCLADLLTLLKHILFFHSSLEVVTLKFYLGIINILYVCVFCLHACMCTTCMLVPAETRGGYSISCN